MKFNLSKARAPLVRLRALHPDFSTLKRSDLDGVDDVELRRLVDYFSTPKTASIGGQPTTFKGKEVDPETFRAENIDDRIKGLKYWMGGGHRYDWPGTQDNTTKWENAEENLKGDPYGRNDYNPVIERELLEESQPRGSGQVLVKKKKIKMKIKRRRKNDPEKPD